MGNERIRQVVPYGDGRQCVGEVDRQGGGVQPEVVGKVPQAGSSTEVAVEAIVCESGSRRLDRAVLSHHLAPDPKNGASKVKMPPSAPTSQYPPVTGSGAMPTTGALSGIPPIEPSKGASPKAKIPPSAPTSQ